MTDIPALFDSFADSLTAIVVALIGAGILGIRRRVKRVQTQVENDHSTNLREELDRRHAETRSWFDLITRRLVNGDERMGRIEEILQRHDRALDDLEDTINPKDKP